MNGQMDEQIYRQTVRQTGSQPDRQTDRQTDEQEDTWTDKQTREAVLFTSVKDDNCIELNSSCHILAEFSMETQAFKCSG